MVLRSSWLNDTIMVDITTNNIKCPLTLSNSLNKVVVSDPLTDKFYYRDAATIGGGSIGPTGATGPSGPLGPQGPLGLQGLPGQLGPQGIQGLSGATGATGGGGISGPSSSLDLALSAFNGTTGNSLISTSMLVAPLGTGIVFPNSSTTTSTQSLDYYEYYTTTLNFFSSGGGLNFLINCPVKILRIGKQVTIQLGPSTGIPPTNGHFIASSAIPTRFNPSNALTVFTLVQNSPNIVSGALSLSSGGIIEIYTLIPNVSILNLGVFVAGNSCGLPQLSLITYLIA